MEQASRRMLAVFPGRELSFEVGGKIIEHIVAREMQLFTYSSKVF